MYGMNNYYQPQYTNPYENRLNALQQPLQAPTQQITRVNGENGARAYNLAPNSSVLLLDENMPVVWLAQSDGAGYRTVTPYTIAPYQPEQPIDTKSLEERISRLEGILNEQSNIKPVSKKSANAKQSDADNATV